MSRRGGKGRDAYHDRVASRYEHIYSDAYWQWHDGLTWDYLRPYLPSDLRAAVIDLGCGTGKWGRRLLKSGYAVTFLDASTGMLEEARRLVEATGDSDRASWVRADLMDLSSLPGEHFALATAMGEPICSTEKPVIALRQIARCLRPDGVLVATYDNRVACLDHYIEQGDLQGLEDFVRTGRTRWLTRDRREQFEMHTFTAGQLRGLYAQAGLEILSIVGKTVLPMRACRELLEDPGTRRRLARLEKRLSGEPENLGRCAHLQVAAKRI